MSREVAKLRQEMIESIMQDKICDSLLTFIMYRGPFL